MNSQLNLNELWKVGSPPANKLKKTIIEKKCWFNNVTLYQDKGGQRHFQVGWLDIFHWPIYSDFTRDQTAADVLIKARMSTCSKNAQAKLTEDRSKGEKIINQ